MLANCFKISKNINCNTYFQTSIISIDNQVAEKYNFWDYEALSLLNIIHKQDTSIPQQEIKKGALLQVMPS